ncbi:hypothetical protein RJ639_033197 [Escallonia herrerae]|uniref:CASP-like protein n=1 Tax=Escallonia herrerae TaxID=1293975 RepID=A0AA88X4N6_9ASTE|nr:hypothetical protein RJ639_033197 [Escallonia herrerae]
MSQFKYEEPKASKLPVIKLGARVVALASLVVSMVILKTNRITYEAGRKFPVAYKDVPTYQYVFFSMVVLFAYTVIQIPFEVYHVLRAKRLVNHFVCILCNFYGDQVCLLILATGVGAIFGATVEIKRDSRRMDKMNGVDAGDYRSEMGKFCDMAYMSAGILLVSFISSGVSSIISAIAVSKKHN